MTTYKTGNPIGSTAVKDLYDNAENLDVLTNDKTKESHPDRLGVPRKTWHGMEEDFQRFLLNSGYQNIGDYGSGLEITARNQIFWRDGELYRAGAVLELPYTTTGDWGAEEGLFVAVGDAALRQELADGTATVTSSTGTQTIAEALDARATLAGIKYASQTVDELEAASIAGLSAGDAALVRDSIFIWSGTQWSPEGLVSYEIYGAVGDGVSDDTSSIQNAINAANGNVFSEGGRTYRITQITFPENSIIEMRDSAFYKQENLGGHTITVGGGSRFDSLCLDVDGGGSVEGIFIQGTVKGGLVKVISTDPTSGRAGSLVNAVLIGPSTGTASNLRINKIEVSNFVRPVVLRNLRHSTISDVEIHTFKRGVYITDCQYLTIEKGECRGLSSESTGTAGDNAILIDSATSDMSSKEITISNFHSIESGEHGFRVGGNSVVDGVRFLNCSSRLSGAANGTGGAGLKVLGGTDNGKRHRNIHIDNLLIEDCSTGGTGQGNFAALQIGYCDYVTITGLIIRKRTRAWSCWQGLLFQACSFVLMSGFSITDVRQYPINITGFPGGDLTNKGMRNITIASGSAYADPNIELNTGAINISVGDFDLSDLTVDSVALGRTTYAVRTLVPDDGSVNNLKFNIVFRRPRNTTGAPPIFNDASIRSQHHVNIRSPWYGTYQSQAADGSLFQGEDGRFRIMKSGSWEVL